MACNKNSIIKFKHLVKYIWEDIRYCICSFILLIIHAVFIYDSYTYFQSITKSSVQFFFAVTFETFQHTFLVRQICVYYQKHFNFKNI